MRPPSSSNALMATSGPMPAGSPIVTRMGRALGSADFDIGLSAQVAHIATRERGDLLVEQLLFDLFSRRHVIGLELGLGPVATHDDLKTGCVRERLGGLTRLGFRQLRLNLLAQLLELHLAQILIHRAANLRLHFLELCAYAAILAD